MVISGLKNACVTKRHAVWVERISTRSTSMFRARLSYFLWFFIMFLSWFVYFRFWSNRGPPRIVLEAAGEAKDLFGWIIYESDFRENSKSWQHDFSNVSHDSFSMKFGAINEQSLPGHFPTIGSLRTTCGLAPSDVEPPGKDLKQLFDPPNQTTSTQSLMAEQLGTEALDSK